jgi:hypothetical protein
LRFEKKTSADSLDAGDRVEWERLSVSALQGECVDKASNIFITDFGAGKIFEYAHAGIR